MCGVVGVSGVENAAEKAFLALYALQHRGQEAAGIAAVDGEGVTRLHKGTGLVADVFDALTSRRPYKEAWPVERALETMRRDAGRHFDPAVIAAFERALPKIMAIYTRHRHV